MQLIIEEIYIPVKPFLAPNKNRTQWFSMTAALRDGWWIGAEVQCEPAGSPHCVFQKHTLFEKRISVQLPLVILDISRLNNFEQVW